MQICKPINADLQNRNTFTVWWQLLTSYYHAKKETPSQLKLLSLLNNKLQVRFDQTSRFLVNNRRELVCSPTRGSDISLTTSNEKNIYYFRSIVFWHGLWEQNKVFIKFLYNQWCAVDFILKAPLLIDKINTYNIGGEKN